MTDQAIALLAPRIGTRAACAAAGVAQASWYRRHRASPPPPQRPAVPQRDRVQPRALSPGERSGSWRVLHAERFADTSPAEVWAILLDEGIYLVSSPPSTGCCAPRTRSVSGARRPPTRPGSARADRRRAQPDLELGYHKAQGPARGGWFDLFVMLDIFSRKAIRWEVHATENAELAKAFIDAAVTSNGGVAPVSIHADRGTSMTSKPVAVLLSDLHISQSHSRPHVCPLTG